MKQQIRVLAVTEIERGLRQKRNSQLIGIVNRGSLWLEGILKTKIKAYGHDSTLQICRMILSSSHYKQIRAIMLDRLIYGRRNRVSLSKLNLVTGLPVLAIVGEYKRKVAQASSLAHEGLSEGEDVFLLRRSLRARPLRINFKGLAQAEAVKLLDLVWAHGNLPEPLRVASEIASALAKIEINELPHLSEAELAET